MTYRLTSCPWIAPTPAPMPTATMTEPTYHQPVLLAPVLAQLRPAPGELFVDGTLGGGGHSEALLMAGARVIGIDQDPQALEFAGRRLARFGAAFTPVRRNFEAIPAVLDELGVDRVDGILLDIGVSSWQLDEASRGFSFQAEGPLDMRMDPEGSVTAADLVNQESEEELTRLFREYGEEKAARRIAAHLVRERSKRPFVTTLDLARGVEAVVPRRGRIHPATKVFQALRMAVNRELEVLQSVLASVTERLLPGGRLGVITFHSLEDRIVKQFLRHHSTPQLDRPEWPAPRPNPDFFFQYPLPKPATASDAEQTANPRSRSARLRVALKRPDLP